MKQYTTPEQTAKLIEFGFEKPKMAAPVLKWVDGEPTFVPQYTVGELIEMLPTHINWTPRVILLNGIEYSFGAVDSEIFIFNLYDELIDNLFDAVVELKKKGMI